VEMLVRYYTGTYSEELVFNPSSGLTSIQNNALAVSSQQFGTIRQPRSSTSSNDVSNLSASRVKASVISREDPKGAVQLPPDVANAKLYALEDHTRTSSPSKSLESLSTDRQGALLGGGQDSHMRGPGLPSSLPDSSSTPIFQPDANSASQRANSELGHYSDPNQRQNSPEWHRNRDAHDGRKTFYSSLGTVAPSPTTIVPPPAPPERVPSPEKLDSKVKISGPMNGAPIPSGFKFGGFSSDATAASNDRREKAKSRSFWGFGKATGEDLFSFEYSYSLTIMNCCR
jgi:RalA-binding protein 1